MGIIKSSLPSEWKIGTSTCLFQNLNFTAADLKNCKEAGIDCLEVLFNGNWFECDYAERELDYRNLAQAGKELGIEFWSVHLPFGLKWDISSLDEEIREKAVLRHEELLKMALVFNPKRAVIHPSYGVIEADFRDLRLANSRKSLIQLADIAHSLGIQLVAECLPRTCLGNTIAEMNKLTEGIGHLEVCCDTNHMLVDTTEEFIRTLGSRISTIHVSDYDRTDEKHWMPGLGVNKWNKIIEALAETGYQGPFMFEVTNPEDRIKPVDLKKCWDNLLNGYESNKCK